MVPFGRILPDEFNRKWVPLTGTVVGHKRVDERNFVMRFLSRRFPSCKLFSLGIKEIVEVRIDRASRDRADNIIEKSGVPILSPVQVPKSEVSKYSVGTRVVATFGFAGMIDQIYRRAMPVRCRLRLIE